MAPPLHLTLYRGAWRRHDDGNWTFQRKPSDLRYTVLVKPMETVEDLETLIRHRYKLKPETPMVMSYHPPDWMLDPNGTRTPPITLTTTSQVETMMHIRSWFAKLKLCVSVGPEDVAHYQCLTETDFSVRGASFVFNGLSGKEVVASKEILEEVFNQQELVVMYRDHFEIEKAKKYQKERGGSSGVSSPSLREEDPPSSLTGSEE
ncbi:hypothetical protein N665_0019s0027 [Sinapis alba]|nr:hypothetical protein N665_0019s0027 [Sinapis alba]